MKPNALPVRRIPAAALFSDDVVHDVGGGKGAKRDPVASVNSMTLPSFDDCARSATDIDPGAASSDPQAMDP